MRLLPGDLVSFRSCAAKVQVIDVRKRRFSPKSTMMNTAEEASRLSELWRELSMIDENALFLVLAASSSKAFLMRCDNGKFLVALDPKDLIVYNRGDDDESEATFHSME